MDLENSGVLPRPAAPCAGINAPRVQNKSGFDRGGSAAIAGGNVNSEQGRKTQDFTTAGSANNFVLLDQEIHVVFSRTLAGQPSQRATQ